MRVVAGVFLVLGFAAATGPAAAQASPLAPGGETDIVGVSGAYDCSVGDAGRVEFSVTGFGDGEYRIEQRIGPERIGVVRYPWQLATATLYRERVGGAGASKFRRLTGSLRTLQELPTGDPIIADYAEAALDGAREAYEWRYEISVGDRAASFAPSGLGEVAVVRIEERRSRYVDGQGDPLPLASAAEGFVREEIADIAYAPKLGLALRIERRGPEGVLEACSLAAYRRR